jgi:UDP-N-acetyl-D-galactosamine dehydrogenase
MEQSPFCADRIAVIGLGYVGLPLAIEFGKHLPTVGFDISVDKITAYRGQIDPSGEVSPEEFKKSVSFFPTTNIGAICEADYIIIAMPTPVDENNNPDFSFLIKASEAVGGVMKPGAIVIYESTVHPGATEEICIPILEKASKSKWMKDFFVGYSPERVAPGDKVMTLTDIVKVVSGDTRETTERIAALYRIIIKAGVFEASSIRVAEAAKIVENIQRDVNIALMNELATIFHRLDIDTNEVLDAASTKWNFSNYRPGLVGGHCISVDPHYMIKKAEEVGHDLSFIRTARKINDSIASFIVDETSKHYDTLEGAKIAILGLTFKENCADIRNAKVFDIIKEYQARGATIYAYDPVAIRSDVQHEYGIEAIEFDNIPVCDVVVLAVPHKEILAKGADVLLSRLSHCGIFVDVKGKMNKSNFENCFKRLWRL